MSLMCHQCQRNDKGRVVRCQKCNRKRFCILCCKTWYVLRINSGNATLFHFDILFDLLYWVLGSGCLDYFNNLLLEVQSLFS